MRALFHAFLEAYFELPCSCEAAEERRRAQPTREAAPLLVRRGRRPKAASEPISAEGGVGAVAAAAAEGMEVDGLQDGAVVKVSCLRRLRWGGRRHSGNSGRSSPLLP